MGKRDIIFVEGEQSRLGMGNDLFGNANSVKRILCPSKNAFDKYDEILNATCKYADTDSLIIIALGQTATVLAKDLSEKGFQALDLGHVDIEYEWFKKGVCEKVVIEGKYVNEVPEGRSTCENDNVEQEYKSQIIATLK